MKHTHTHNTMISVSVH